MSEITVDELLARVQNGGLMGFNTYMKWTKEELISAIIEHEQHLQEKRYRNV